MQNRRKGHLDKTKASKDSLPVLKLKMKRPTNVLDKHHEEHSSSANQQGVAAAPLADDSAATATETQHAKVHNAPALQNRQQTNKHKLTGSRATCRT
jgi:hypothetical protein